MTVAAKNQLNDVMIDVATALTESLNNSGVITHGIGPRPNPKTKLSMIIIMAGIKFDHLNQKFNAVIKSAAKHKNEDTNHDGLCPKQAMIGAETPVAINPANPTRKAAKLGSKLDPASLNMELRLERKALQPEYCWKNIRSAEINNGLMYLRLNIVSLL